MLVQCRDHPVGYIEVQYTVVKNIMVYCSSNNKYDCKSTHEDYCKDMLTRLYYGCSYIHYLQVLIDIMCKSQDEVVETGDKATFDSCIAIL